MKAFISYTRDKDEFEAISDFRRHFANELRQILPYSTVFQDNENIDAGDVLPERLKREVLAAELLVILISPAWLASKWCRWEFELFTAKEQDNGRSPRVLPVLWVTTYQLDSPGDDHIAQQLSSIKYADWRELRHEDWKNATIRKEIARLAERAKTIMCDQPADTAERDSSVALSADTIVPPAAIPNLFKTVLSDWQFWLKGEDPFGSAGRQYIQTLIQRYDSVRILGMEAPVSLRSIYVHVNILSKITARHTASEQDLEHFFSKDKRGFGSILQSTTALEVVNRLQYVIVLGKPGAGKSTFLKYLALLAADGALAVPRIPIFVSLKEWSDSGESLLQFIATQFATCNFSDALPYVRRLLSKGKCLLLLDGLDEVSGDTSRAIALIKAFYSSYSTNQFILSCRIAAYDYVFEQFTETEIADFGDHEIENFITNWFGEGSPKASQCWEELKGERPIHDLARTPLLLTMLCLAFEEQMAFPQNRAELYQEAVNALLKKWDSSRNIKRTEPYKQLTPKRKVGLLSYIAFQTFPQGQYFLKSAILEKHVQNYIEHLSGFVHAASEIDSEAIVRSIEAQHGLLVERSKSVYSFSHLTLQEYFTACYIFEHWSEQQCREMLTEHLFQSEWREVILLASAMVSSADELLVTMRKTISMSTKRQTRVLLEEVRQCVRSTSPAPTHVSRVRALLFFLDRLHGLSVAGERSSGLHQDYPREDSPFDLGPEPTFVLPAYPEDLGRVFERAKTIAGTMDRDFNRIDLRQSVDFTRALEFVRAHDRVRQSFVSLDKYLYATDLIYQCLKGECYVSKTIRAQLLDGLFLETLEEGNE
jgi:TIR domain/NACHT domain